MTIDVSTDALATELLDALDRNVLIEPITDRDPAFDEAAAYQVNAELFRRRCARGEQPIGRKIGFTNRTIWPEYGVYTPMWAHVYDTTVTFFEGNSGAIEIGHLAQPRIEPEILLHFKSSPAGARTEAEILECIDWIAHSVEIVQSHFPDWKFKAPDTAAAFGLHGALMVGPPRPISELGHARRADREAADVHDRALAERRGPGAGRRRQRARLAAAGVRAPSDGAGGSAPVRAGPGRRDRDDRHPDGGPADRARADAGARSSPASRSKAFGSALRPERRSGRRGMHPPPTIKRRAATQVQCEPETVGISMELRHGRFICVSALSHRVQYEASRTVDHA